MLCEPPLKLLRYQQQFSFFDAAKVDGSIRYLNLSHEVLSQDLGKVLDRIVSEVERANPGIVVVDSFRTVVRAASVPGAGRDRVAELRAAEAASNVFPQSYRHHRRGSLALASTVYDPLTHASASDVQL